MAVTVSSLASLAVSASIRIDVWSCAEVDGLVPGARLRSVTGRVMIRPSVIKTHAAI